jgi:hypothetical protein
MAGGWEEDVTAGSWIGTVANTGVEQAANERRTGLLKTKKGCANE